MLWYELKKVWCRPIVLLTLLIMMIAQVMFITTNQLQDAQRTLKPYYESYEGVMDPTWNISIIQQYEAYIQDQDHWVDGEAYLKQANMNGWTKEKTTRLQYDPFTRLSDNAKYDPNFIVLGYAYKAAHIHEALSAYVASKSQELHQRYPTFDLSLFHSLYEHVDAFLSSTTFSCDYGYRMMQGCLSFMIRTYVMLMIVVLAQIFTQDPSTKTLEVIVTTKYGTKTLQYVKVWTAIISGFIGWCLLVFVSAMTIAFTLGFEGGDMLVQDFMFNSSFLPFNASEYLWFLLVMSICSSVVISMCILMCGAWVKKSSHAILLSMMIMLVPPLWNHEGGWLPEVLYFHPSNFVSFNYIVSSFHVTQLGQIVLPSCFIVFFLIMVLPIIGILMIHKRNPKSYIISSCSAAE